MLILLALLAVGCRFSQGREGMDFPSNHTLKLSEPGVLKPVEREAGVPLKIVASTSIVGDVAAQVGGDHIHLSVLIPRGTDPHAYQPTPGDIQALYQADVILLNGFQLEAGLEDILAPVSQSVPALSLSEGLQARTFDDDDHRADIDNSDPHVWFDPNLVSHWVERIEQALSRLDPEHAADYQENARQYQAQLSDLDGWIQEQVASIPADRRKLVLDHLVLGYFADRYGFEVISALVPAFSSAAEATPRELAELTQILRNEAIPAIFIGVDTNPRLAEQIAGDMGIQVVELYTGSLGAMGDTGETYVEMMQYNVIAIQKALSQD